MMNVLIYEDDDDNDKSGDDNDDDDDDDDDDDEEEEEDEVNDGLSHFLATLVREELTTEICSVHHSSRSISYFALIICATIATMRMIMTKEKISKMAPN